MKIREVQAYLNKELNNVEDGILKSKILMMNLLGVSKEYLLIHDNDEFPEEKLEELKNKITRLKNNEPIQYIINKQEFFGCDFYVDENVLIPQPDTEILVEEAINISTKMKEMCKTNIKILDLCTGSGAIAVSLAKNIENADVVASDISQKALEIANKNSILNNVEINFIHSDLYENIKEKFNMIVSNPPYIRTGVIKELSKEVQKEPHIALDGGEDGLKFYKKIIEESKQLLENNGYLLLEIGFDQRKDVIELLEKNNYKNIYFKKDLGSNDRIVVAQIN